MGTPSRSLVGPIASRAMADATTEALPRLSLGIHAAVRDAQTSHGVKHGDLERYRSYCARRLVRLRKSLRATSATDDARVLLVPFIEAERAWAAAQEIRKEVERSKK